LAAARSSAFYLCNTAAAYLSNRCLPAAVADFEVGVRNLFKMIALKLPPAFLKGQSVGARQFLLCFLTLTGSPRPIARALSGRELH
jgi:hypothetical protein